MTSLNPILGQSLFSLDTSACEAFSTLLESRWEFNIYGSQREIIIRGTADVIFNYFLEKYPHIQYRVFYGNYSVMWTDSFLVKFRGELFMPKRVNAQYDGEITISGELKAVKAVAEAFDIDFKDILIPNHHRVSMVIQGSHGLDKISLPVKTDRVFHPEMYPVISDPKQFINDFLSSTANVLILMGPPGLGKSALINEIILTAEVPTQIVFDVEVMKNEKLYTGFINQSLNEGGGLMIMEDADTILRDRETFNNDMMSRLLNISDGIMNTSDAKFIFSANINDKSDVDSALTRPGRCFDIVEFRNLTRKEAETAAKAVGIELFDDDKEEYTVAEIFNSKANRKEKKKFGFI